MKYFYDSKTKLPSKKEKAKKRKKSHHRRHRAKKPFYGFHIFLVCISLFKRPIARWICFFLFLSFLVHFNSHKIVNKTRFFQMKTQNHIQFPPPKQLLLRFYKLYFIIYSMFQLKQFISTCFCRQFVCTPHITYRQEKTPRISTHKFRNVK